LKNLTVKYWEEAENNRVINQTGYNKLTIIVTDYLDSINVEYTDKQIKRLLENVYEKTHDDTFQSMEAFIHNLNTMHCLPSSEKIWVLNVKNNEFRSITMEELHNTFETNKYKVVSLNKETGKAEFKFITHCKKLDNNRNIVTIEDNQGRKVRVTDNHRLMTVNELNITEAIPSECSYTVSPRGIKFPAAKYDFCVADYGKPRSDNPFQNDHVLLTEEFAEFIGYYIGDGCILGETSTCCISACGKVSFKYMEELLEKVFGCKLKTSYTYFNHSKNGVTEKDIRIQLGMPLAKMIRDKFGRIGAEKKIPTELMFASDDIKKAFLKAYFSMDGRQDRKYSELSTANKELQAQIALMISSLGCSSHYTTRTCNNGFDKSKERLDMHFLTISGHDSAMLGLKDSDETAFEIPKYSLENVYNAYTKECDELSNRRESHNLRYSELDELIDNYSAEDTEKFRNIFINSIETKESAISKEYVYDISVEDNENFLTYECIYVHNSRAGAQVNKNRPSLMETLNCKGAKSVESLK
jgi:intein/homing endonuclease